MDSLDQEIFYCLRRLRESLPGRHVRYVNDQFFIDGQRIFRRTRYALERLIEDHASETPGHDLADMLVELLNSTS